LLQRILILRLKAKRAFDLRKVVYCFLGEDVEPYTKVGVIVPVNGI
jgi:hypothetical protein